MKGKILCPAGCQNPVARITKAKEILKNPRPAGSWRPLKCIFSGKGKSRSQREAKPRTLHRESIVLDGGRMNTLDHLNQTPQSWIRQQYAQQGYTVAAIHKGESLTAKVDTGFLWKLAALDAAAAKAGKSVAKLLEGGAAV